MIIRAKNKGLFEGRPLNELQQKNTDLNIEEMNNNAEILKSYPRRLVLELTNDCNINCKMCGRHSADFKMTSLPMSSFYALEPLFNHVEEVTLMGWGEPTKHPHFKEMLEVLSKYPVRIYFLTNGMLLDELTDIIFESEVEIFGVSLDGANQETNNEIRRGADFNKINDSLRKIVKIKKENNLKYPHMNYCFCAMESNIHELVEMVELTAEVGLEELKVVYLTAFNEHFLPEVLWNKTDKVRAIFEAAEKRANELGVLLKLPHLQGEDPAGRDLHKECYVAYRDFYLGSDGYVRPCMSTPDKFFKFNEAKDFMSMWNHEAYQKHRRTVNTSDMPENCKNCYQSSHCNWNRKRAHIQIDTNFAPKWEE